VHAELAQETQKTVELMDSIEQQSSHLYHAEPPVDMPFIPPNTNLVQKAGYLMMRRSVLLYYMPFIQLKTSLVQNAGYLMMRRSVLLSHSTCLLSNLKPSLVQKAGYLMMRRSVVLTPHYYGQI
jgi:hypothetical protein